MPYCRFYWFYLLAVQRALARGSTPYHLGRHVWHVGRAVILRVGALLRRLEPWVEALRTGSLSGW